MKHKEVINNLIDWVCEEYHLDKDMLTNRIRTRKQPYVDTRHMLYKVIYQRYLNTERPLALKDIGTFFGGQDHSTIIHGIQRAEQLSSNEKEYNDMMQRIALRLSEIDVSNNMDKRCIIAHLKYEKQLHREAVACI